MRRAGLAANTLAEYGRRPYLSRSPVVRSSQHERSANAEATRSNGTAKPAPGAAGKAATAEPSAHSRAAKAPAGSFISAAKGSSAAARRGMVGTPSTGAAAYARARRPY